MDLKNYSKQLEDRVRERTAEMHAANMDAIYMLAEAAEAKDHDTGRHVRRIQAYSRTWRIQLKLTDAEAEELGYSAILHDVGKLHVPDRILAKPGPLDPDEHREMQGHTIVGEKILSPRTVFLAVEADRAVTSRELGRQRLPRSPRRAPDSRGGADRACRGCL